VHYKTIDEEWKVIPQGTFSQRKVKRFQAVATSEDYVQKWVEQTEAFDEQLACSGCGNVGTGYRKLFVSNPRVAICGDCLRVGVTDA
jgi:tryptophan synthase beta subunit